MAGIAATPSWNGLEERSDQPDAVDCGRGELFRGGSAWRDAMRRATGSSHLAHAVTGLLRDGIECVAGELAVCFALSTEHQTGRDRHLLPASELVHGVLPQPAQALLLEHMGRSPPILQHRSRSPRPCSTDCRCSYERSQKQSCGSCSSLQQ